eukprot:CAMPEP_0113304482 /NCGR_PEP_ID=MMETSP0010_2-20120614/4485_1 /TAXON_ID=216773 ORGANISM="Corethron hystrix, Strain 308" /NCGR_SAMPLE_ID=MMETSP0010_2 /ASSEMBLY_ACC=CAM_ASM_000155 /LENGTH=463 /DNA_ID=CAMNT_0000158697 /DNA_START=192 /DNA_END=1580 /DNA_ORIENTATION=+ /assembly_acc=CAM_ASM_000155
MEENEDFVNGWCDRQELELLLLKSAYSPEKLRCFPYSTEGKDETNCDERCGNKVVRRLRLPCPSMDDDTALEIYIDVDLILRLPPGYPSYPESAILVDARLVHSTEKKIPRPAEENRFRKVGMEALPSLLEVCRHEASIAAEETIEAAMSIIIVADTWVDEHWRNVASDQADGSVLNKKNSAVENEDVVERQFILGRRLIYSHHIIAQSKRKAIAQLASELDLGGYFKIGWPGIIIIEGTEENCIIFFDSIKQMRWQHISVRGEQQIKIKPTESFDDCRLFEKMEELGKDQMSFLAEKCRDVGLENLFKTALKIYENDEEEVIPKKDSTSLYGAMVLVDHMNDPKNYKKSLKKMAKETDCTLVLTHCLIASNENSKPMIIVIIFGQQIGVKRLFKLWRTSTIDVDKRGKKCLERMISIVVEGEICHHILELQVFQIFQRTCDHHTTGKDDMSKISRIIGGDRW